MTPDAPDVRGAALDSSALLARLPGVSLLRLTVTGVEVLTPALRRVHLTSPELDTFDHVAGQDLMFAIPEPVPGSHVRRRYTIRHLDRAARALDVDVVVHDDGPGARWAAQVAPGDTVEAIGPRGKIALNPDADWHLFIGDESGLPGALAMSEAVAVGGRAVVLAEVDGPDAELPAASAPSSAAITVHWVHRNGVGPGSAEPLLDALAALDWPAGAGHAYLAAELGVVAALRRALGDRGMGAEQISAKAYWRRGVANAAHGEPTAE